tara:strand:- start:635 stop:1756 length:1122 start_codon:yes stop_codon:yes gene_type:complete
MIDGINKYTVGILVETLMDDTSFLHMKDKDSKMDPSLFMMTLSCFMEYYSEEVEERLSIDKDECIYEYSHKSNGNEVLILVDMAEDITHSMTLDIRKKFSKSARAKRRNRMREQYDYNSNVFNRIHGYCFLSEVFTNTENSIGCGLEHLTIMKINLIVTSVRSNRYGVGSYMIEAVKRLCRESRFTDIVLEVANDIVEYIEEDGDIDVKYPYELEDKWEEDYQDYLDYQDTVINLHSPITLMSKMLWKMCMRHIHKISNRTGKIELVPYYNIDIDYIRDFLETYLMGLREDKPIGLNCDKTYFIGYTNTQIEKIPEQPAYNEYGGKLYNESIIKISHLIEWYRHMGFHDAPYVNYKWSIFTHTPYHAMRLDLT